MKDPLWLTPEGPQPVVTLRDQLAMAALPEVIRVAYSENWAQHGDQWRLQAALEAYNWADDMMTLRSAEVGDE